MSHILVQRSSKDDDDGRVFSFYCTASHGETVCDSAALGGMLGGCPRPLGPRTSVLGGRRTEELTEDGRQNAGRSTADGEAGHGERSAISRTDKFWSGIGTYTRQEQAALR